ncbi:MAG: FAD-dependent oxidoreductase [Phenylobacterium sp.]|uniref:NAD(P)/FAD-dependent oxidoreductase n=1 Tax=Phenylobacterium sp. TaxID=1871053 RepID=UPI0027331F8B|nr:FAD-dependent oxidoreductase [Phenylobacterium sp.]MDP1641731.1 FAD-dependent oxidoreductase [Phenylobacterium sp.]MDP3118389.1 FAD-dependent oxidoreductase [Phenylobacterium sp.]
MRLVLVGAGHAHLHLLAQAGALRAAGLDVTLIAPAGFHYSGLATGVLSGALPSAAARIDVAALAASRHVQHLQTTVEGVDLSARIVRLARGADLPFDLVSFNVGSTVQDPMGLAGAAEVWPAKPLSRLFDLKARLEAELKREGPPPRVVVAGSGQTGFEIAAAIAGLCARHGQQADVTIVSRTTPHWGPAAALASLRRRLAARGIVVAIGEVVGREAGHCRLADGHSLACDMLVLAGGLVAPPLISGLGLPTDDAGRLRVTPALHARDDPAVFAAGDCAVIEASPRPPVGVFGVRAAPILAANLMARAQGGALRAYEPQRRWLSIMDLGDGTGLALRGRLWWRGRAALWLKRRLDLGFVAAARGLRPGA